MSLFKKGSFKLHSGAPSSFLIDCDALTASDLEALALFARERIPPFGRVEGVPQGGLRFAIAMAEHATEGPLLIVDDVLTSGGSMEEHRAGREANGLVIFARGPCPGWVDAIFQM